MKELCGFDVNAAAPPGSGAFTADAFMNYIFMF